MRSVFLSAAVAFAAAGFYTGEVFARASSCCGSGTTTSSDSGADVEEPLDITAWRNGDECTEITVRIEGKMPECTMIALLEVEGKSGHYDLRWKPGPGDATWQAIEKEVTGIRECPCCCQCVIYIKFEKPGGTVDFERIKVKNKTTCGSSCNAAGCGCNWGCAASTTQPKTGSCDKCDAATKAAAEKAAAEKAAAVKAAAVKAAAVKAAAVKAAAEKAAAEKAAAEKAAAEKAAAEKAAAQKAAAGAAAQ